MKDRVRTALHLFLVTLFGSPLLMPLLHMQQVPCTHDGHLHYHRVAAIRHAWENGLYFSRWLPDLAFGYGYPFFLYREPLPLYLTHFLHLSGLPLPAATNLFYVGSILAAGWFTYLWVRDVFGAPAGLVAAVAYMAAPYQLVDALVRGNQVESLALALFPLLLWAGRRFLLAVEGRRAAIWFLVTTAGLVVLALSHNISLLLFTPVLGLYLLSLGLSYRQRWRPLLLRLLLLFGLGLGLTSFYTGPALLEMDEVTLSQSTTTRNNDFRYNFTSLEEIFAAVPPEDPGLINPPLPFRVGWAPIALAILGLLSVAWLPEREQRIHVVMMAVAAVLFLLLSLPLTRALWQGLPLIRFVQFPWRLVGRAALPIAMLAGALFACLGQFLPAWRTLNGSRRLLYLLLPLSLTLLLVEAFPLLYPSYCREEGFPSIADVHEYEQTTGLVGVDPEGSYFPQTVAQRPDSSPLLADYAAGRQPQRFDLDALPEGAQLRAASYAPNEARLVVETPVAFQARYLAFAFPGWTATVDGERVQITPSATEGLITFPVTPGEHTLTINWESTPLRTTFGGLSGLALVGIAITAFALWRQPSQRTKPATDADPSLAWQGHLLLLTVGVLLLAGKILLVDRLETPLRREAPPPVTYPLALQAAELSLAGYNLSETRVPAGSTVDVHLAWEVEAAPAAAYQSNVWLVGPEGYVWSDKETQRPRLYEATAPTVAWTPGQWAWDSREIVVYPGTPPGRYDLVLTVFRRADLQPLTLQRGTGLPPGPTAIIGQIEVTRPPDPPLLQPQYPQAATIEGIRLLGYDQDRAEAAPGDPLLLTLFWEKEAGGTGSTALPLQLRTEAGEIIQEWQIPPVRADYPPGTWVAGERLRGPHLLRLPPAVDSGHYRFWLGNVPLGDVVIEAPARTFTLPAYEVPVGTELGGKVRLLGYTLTPVATAEEAEAVEVTLIWEALAEMETSYRVFVHLLNEEGQIIAQADAEPAGWTRPTTGWVPGEYIEDQHRLVLPEALSPAPLTLRVGLYEPGSNQRLGTPGADFILLSPETENQESVD